MTIQVTNLSAKEVMKEIIKNDQEDGFFICDVSDVMEKYRIWKKVMPRVKPFYAMKANDSRVVMETLVALGLSFDCASKGEIMKVLSLGVTPEKIIFANPTKFISHIKYASKVGVNKMAFDTEDELYKIKKSFPEAELVIRIRSDDPEAFYQLGKKYGADPNTEARKLLKIAKSLNLDVIGVAFHIGSGCKNFSVYKDAIASAREVFDMGSDLGYNFRLLDIGGGFPGNRNNDIYEIADIVNDALDQYFPDQSIQIISEPGKYFVDSAFMLATSIHTTKTVTNNSENGKCDITKIYYANQSIYQALMTVTTGEIVVPILVFNKPRSPVYPSIIWGSTLDVFDKLTDTILLPELKSGDWLYFENTGAYTICMVCEFNSFPTAAVHSIIKPEDWIVLTKEVTKPVPEDRFVVGDGPEHLTTGLNNPYSINSTYF